ncbi:MAG: RNA methyltransferase, partial [Candidatus Korobacteraceae bacterium]
IPTSQQAPSMNLAQAVVVVLYELARTWNQTSASVESEATPAADPAAKMQSLLRLGAVMHETLEDCGYYSEAAAASEEQLRRLLLRMKLTEADSEIVLGMFRHILWKLRTNSPE